MKVTINQQSSHNQIRIKSKLIYFIKINLESTKTNKNHWTQMELS
jgi:hypothetical protein